MRDDILQMVQKHTTKDATMTGLEGFQLFRITEPIERIPGVYPPSICGILQGSKHTYLNGEELVYNESSYLCSTIPIPVEAEVPFATPDEPVLGFLISLETRVLTELLMELESLSALGAEPRDVGKVPGITVVPWDESFTRAVWGLMNLLGEPVAVPVLGAGKLREIMFSLVRGEVGPLLRRNVGSSRDLFRVLSYIRENLSQPITIQDLIKQAGMSKAVLHRKFKEATTLSPLQFIKALRLNEAAMMIAQGTNVSQAAYEVGYESLSQFSREFRRHYGSSPRQWANSDQRVSV